jgi:type II secretory pathway pseudopilin PulG
MRKLAQETGIGLVEVLVALSLFALVASGLAVTTVGAVRGNDSSRMLSTASALVHDQIEELRSLDSEAIPFPADLAEGEHADAANPMTGTGEPDGVFTREWTVTHDMPRRNIARVEVWVSWEGMTAPVMGVTYICIDSICG